MPIEQGIGESGNGAREQGRMSGPRDVIVSHRALEKSNSAPIEFDVRPRDLVGAIVFNTKWELQVEKLAAIIRKTRESSRVPVESFGDEDLRPLPSIAYLRVYLCPEGSSRRSSNPRLSIYCRPQSDCLDGLESGIASHLSKSARSD